MRTYFLLITALALGACANHTEADKNATNTLVDVSSVNVYGDTITEEGAMDPTAFLAQMEGKDTLNSKLKAVIKETCARKGCWMTVDMGNGKEMSVNFKDYGFYVPTEGMEGKTAVISGKAYTDTVSVEELRHLAEDAGKSEDEIAAITKPEIGTGFTANGVLIEK